MPVQRIDCHSHIIPPEYRKFLEENGHKYPDGMPGVPPWTPEDHLKLMDTHSIKKSLISISSPGTHLQPGQDELAIKFTRSCNTYMASLKQQYPERFGYFASLPLPSVSAALTEIDQALSEGADGFCLLTNSHGHYLGESIYDPVFEKLNEKKAIVFIHPTTPCTACPGPNGQGEIVQKAAPLAQSMGHRMPMYEFLLDTARCLTNLFVSGTVSSSPDITLILPHSGGAFPPLFSRVSEYTSIVPGGGHGTSEAEVRKQLLTQCYFDLAGWVFSGEEDAKGQLLGMMTTLGVGCDRIVFGTDYCFTNAGATADFIERMDKKMEVYFKEDEVEKMMYGNAERMLRSKESQK